MLAWWTVLVARASTVQMTAEVYGAVAAVHVEGAWTVADAAELFLAEDGFYRADLEADGRRFQRLYLPVTPTEGRGREDRWSLGDLPAGTVVRGSIDWVVPVRVIDGHGVLYLPRVPHFGPDRPPEDLHLTLDAVIHGPVRTLGVGAPGHGLRPAHTTHHARRATVHAEGVAPRQASLSWTWGAWAAAYRQGEHVLLTLFPDETWPFAPPPQDVVWWIAGSALEDPRAHTTVHRLLGALGPEDRVRTLGPHHGLRGARDALAERHERVGRAREVATDRALRALTKARGAPQLVIVTDGQLWMRHLPRRLDEATDRMHVAIVTLQRPLYPKAVVAGDWWKPLGIDLVHHGWERPTTLGTVRMDWGDWAVDERSPTRSIGLRAGIPVTAAARVVERGEDWLRLRRVDAEELAVRLLVVDVDDGVSIEWALRAIGDLDEAGRDAMEAWWGNAGHAWSGTLLGTRGTP